MDSPGLSVLASAFLGGITSYDTLAAQLRKQAATKSNQHLEALQTSAWENKKSQIKNNIISRAGIQFFPDLPLLMKETKRIRMDQFEIAAIRFQTLPGVFATATLYIPDGYGPFPGVVLTHGHWTGGRNSELFQEVAQHIVNHGYVCLAIDAWGTGERSTVHGEAEYHGNNLGATLLNVGWTLMGIQVTENIRAVDLLRSLPMVNSEKLGATGASGGGNQAMWLAAIDERIKAVVPVVSVGTFQSYIMNSNCVCELLPGGLTFTEEAGVLGLIAPRALCMINAKQETNSAFMPQEMLRSYRYARPIFEALHAGDRIDYKLIDSGHGFDQAMQAVMIAWFDRCLEPERSIAISPLPPKILAPIEIATYEVGKRENEVLSTAVFCMLEGRRQRDIHINASIDAEEKRRALVQLLDLPDCMIERVEKLPDHEEWEVMDLHISSPSSDDRLPVFVRHPTAMKGSYAILVHSQGYANLPDGAVSDVLKNGQGVVVIDLWGTGSRSSKEAMQIDGSLSPHHTLARSALWFGQTMMGRWAGELLCVMRWIQSFASGTEIHLIGFREAGLAALYASVFEPELTSTTVTDTPVSYLVDDVDGVNYYNMSVHVPGILPWGDIGLLCALSHGSVIFRSPRTFAGNQVEGSVLAECRVFFERLGRAVDQENVVKFE